MLEKIFPSYILLKIQDTINEESINEIRVRINKPLVVVAKGKFYYLSKSDGLNQSKNNAYICTKKLIDDILSIVTEKSMYAVNNQLVKGFISVEGGIRIGICGEMVYHNGTLSTVRNILSLNIRFPHEVSGCSLKILDYILSDNLHSTLILSPPGAGKTTMLRDIAYQLGKMNYAINVLVLDERGELAGLTTANEPLFNVGEMTDVSYFATKQDGFSFGIRSMNPDVIITDEIVTKEDINSIVNAANSGVTVIASVHAKDINELILKPSFEYITKSKIFDRYIILSKRAGYGTVEAVYNKQFKLMELK